MAAPPKGGRRKPQAASGSKRPELNPWLNAKQAAAHTGLAVGTIYNAVQRREMTVRRAHDKAPFYIRLDELERWFEATHPVVPAL